MTPSSPAGTRACRSEMSIPPTSFPTGPAHHFFMDRFTDAFRAELAAFVDVANGNAAPACTVADAVEVAWLAEAATESLQRGVPVRIEEVRSPMKIAGAPISWGVCEVPGWGHQLTPERVLAEMRDVGLAATELGPEGFLPSDPAQLTALLNSYGLAASASSPRWCCTTPDHDPLPDIAAPLDAFVACGADVLVLAAATGADGYDARPTWTTAVGDTAGQPGPARRRRGRPGVLAVLHPHVGTMVETRDEVDRVLDGSAIPLCLDTGHLLIGGTDPLQLAREVPDRIAHAHLKDVDASLAAACRRAS